MILILGLILMRETCLVYRLICLSLLTSHTKVRSLLFVSKENARSKKFITTQITKQNKTLFYVVAGTF